MTKDPAGASSGAAVATAAGFAPLAIGAEVVGGLVQPATRAALYGLKPTTGSIDLAANLAGNSGLMCVGPMAKSVEDCASLLDVMLPGRDFSACVAG